MKTQIETVEEPATQTFEFVTTDPKLTLGVPHMVSYNYQPAWGGEKGGTIEITRVTKAGVDLPDYKQGDFFYAAWANVYARGLEIPSIEPDQQFWQHDDCHLPGVSKVAYSSEFLAKQEGAIQYNLGTTYFLAVLTLKKVGEKFITGTATYIRVA